MAPALAEATRFMLGCAAGEPEGDYDSPEDAGSDA